MKNYLLLLLLFSLFACGKDDNQYLAGQAAPLTLSKKLESSKAPHLYIKDAQISLKFDIQNQEHTFFDISPKSEFIASRVLQATLESNYSPENMQLLYDFSLTDQKAFLAAYKENPKKLSINIRSQLWAKNMAYIDQLRFFKVHFWLHDGLNYHKVASDEFSLKEDINGNQQKVIHHFDFSLHIERPLALNRRSKLFIEFEAVEVITDNKLSSLDDYYLDKYRIVVVKDQELIDVWYKPSSQTLAELLESDFQITYKDKEIHSISGINNQFSLSHLKDIFNLTKDELGVNTIMSHSNTKIHLEVSPKKRDQYIFYAGKLSNLKRHLSRYEKISSGDFYQLAGSSLGRGYASSVLNLPSEEYFELDLYQAAYMEPDFQIQTGRVEMLDCRRSETGRGNKGCQMRRNSSKHCYFERKLFSGFSYKKINMAKFINKHFQLNNNWQVSSFVNENAAFYNFSVDNRSSMSLFFLSNPISLGAVNYNYIKHGGSCTQYNLRELPKSSFSLYENIQFKYDLYRVKYFSEES